MSELEIKQKKLKKLRIRNFILNTICIILLVRDYGGLPLIFDGT